MAAEIVRCSGDKRHQLVAARAFSNALDCLEIKHVITGSFAVYLYGCLRPTENISVLVDLPASKIYEYLRPQIAQRNPHFVQMDSNCYYALTLVDGLTGKELLFANKANVKIEILPTNYLGLPRTIEPRMMDWELGLGIPTLHPSFLVFSRIKRWQSVYKSIYPVTHARAQWDFADIRFLTKWLADRQLMMSFVAYDASSPGRVARAVRTYATMIQHVQFSVSWEHFRMVVGTTDWEGLNLNAT